MGGREAAQGETRERHDMAVRMKCSERVALYQNCPNLPFTNAKLAASVGLTVEDFAGLEVTKASCNVVYDALGKSILDSLFDGFNTSIRCSGPRGSGKRYTLFGPRPPLSQDRRPMFIPVVRLLMASCHNYSLSTAPCSSMCGS